MVIPRGRAVRFTRWFEANRRRHDPPAAGGGPLAHQTHASPADAGGSGKTKFLEYLIQQDLAQGNGFGVIDPHGDLVEDIKGMLAIAAYGQRDSSLLDRVVLIEPTAPDETVTFNPLERMPGTSAAEQAQEFVSAFAKVWSDSWGVRMEDLLRHSLIALSEAGLSLVELPPFLSEDKRMVKKQQMQWTPEGAHLLLQVRTKVLNAE